MKLARFAIFSILGAILFSYGCTTVSREYQLTDQSLNAAMTPGKARVLFFNDTILALYPLSNRIGIKVGGRGVAAPFSGEYVQVDLEKGTYDLHLSHFDVFYFTDKYSLPVDRDKLNVRVYNSPVATAFEVVENLPAGFERIYKPVGE
jgi:hypothetical protein